MNPWPWSVASRGCPDLVDIHSLKGTVVSKPTFNIRPLTVITTLSYRLRTYEYRQPVRKGRSVQFKPRLQSSLASPFLLLACSLVSVRRAPFVKVDWPFNLFDAGFDRLDKTARSNLRLSVEYKTNLDDLYRICRKASINELSLAQTRVVRKIAHTLRSRSCPSLASLSSPDPFSRSRSVVRVDWCRKFPICEGCAKVVRKFRAVAFSARG